MRQVIMVVSTTSNLKWQLIDSQCFLNSTILLTNGETSTLNFSTFILGQIIQQALSLCSGHWQITYLRGLQ